MRRRLHVCGSASRDVDLALLRDTHAVIRETVYGWVAGGGGVVAGLGAEPPHAVDPEVSIIFDWSVAKAVLAALRDGHAQPQVDDGCLLAVRTSRKQFDAVPEYRRPVLEELMERRALDLELLPDTWRSGALMRRAQAKLGGVLVCFSGGAGVEDLANLYVERDFPVIAVDVALGSSQGDGALGGGTGLARRALSDPASFLRLADGSPAGARLMLVAMGAHRPPAAVVAERLLALLGDLVLPSAFCVRLLDRGDAAHADVEWFFREVAQPVLEADGLRAVDFTQECQERAWMNDEIFHKLHFADTVIVDLTAGRPNCFIELGYALGRAHRTIVTACAGQSMPFDADKLPWHFWDPRASAADQRRAFDKHIAQFGGRPPLIEPLSLI